MLVGHYFLAALPHCGSCLLGCLATPSDALHACCCLRVSANNLSRKPNLAPSTGPLCNLSHQHETSVAWMLIGLHKQKIAEGQSDDGDVALSIRYANWEQVPRLFLVGCSCTTRGYARLFPSLLAHASQDALARAKVCSDRAEQNLCCHSLALGSLALLWILVHSRAYNTTNIHI